MNKQLLLAACIVGTASGCSLLVDTSPYIGTADGATADGGTDAGISDNAPSTPEIDLTPDAPRTADDLTATITRESVDPLGETATYEYLWRRDGTVVEGETDATIPAALTTRGQTWRVEVTPTTPDGRRGVAASAQVTIENTLRAPRHRERRDRRIVNARIA